MIGIAPRGFVPTLVGGILAVTFIPLGIVFSIVFGALGFIFLAVGLVLATASGIAFARGRAHAAREEAARVSHGTATVVEAKHNYNSQIGVRHPLKLTVDLAGGRHTRSLLVVSHIDFKPGETVEVAYAPDDPANFLPVS